MEHHEHEKYREPNEGPPRLTPRIYVASLSDYNAGRLHGCRLHAAVDDVNELQAGIDRLMMTSPEPYAEEWAIHDYEGFGMAHLSEYQSLETVVRIARGIEQHGPAFAAWANTVGLDDVEALDRFEDSFLGTWDSAKEYAEGLLDDLGLNSELDEAIPELLQGYISVDVTGFARDMEMGGMITVIENPDGSGVWIFDGSA
jgi:antirestriction protein